MEIERLKSIFRRLTTTTINLASAAPSVRQATIHVVSVGNVKLGATTKNLIGNNARVSVFIRVCESWQKIKRARFRKRPLSLSLCVSSQRGVLHTCVNVSLFYWVCFVGSAWKFERRSSGSSAGATSKKIQKVGQDCCVVFS